jgi:hypothetical protein
MCRFQRNDFTHGFSLWYFRFSLASMKMTSFWDIALCSLVEVNQRFGDAYPDGGSMHLQNVDPLQLNYNVLYPRKLSSSWTLLFVTFVDCPHCYTFWCGSVISSSSISFVDVISEVSSCACLLKWVLQSCSLLIISCILISKGCSSVKPLQIQQLQNDMKSYIIWASIETFFLFRI